MKRIVLALVVAGCSGNGDIGLSSQPVTCQPAAAGAARGTVTNSYTKKSYTFGSVAAALSPASPASSLGVLLDDSLLRLSIDFSCGQPELGMYDVGAGQQACPFLANSTVSASNQAVYGVGTSGVVIVDQNTGCLAGRYDVTFTTTADTGAVTNDGEVAGWFSVPLQ